MFANIDQEKQGTSEKSGGPARGRERERAITDWADKADSLQGIETGVLLPCSDGFQPCINAKPVALPPRSMISIIARE